MQRLPVFVAAAGGPREATVVGPDASGQILIEEGAKQPPCHWLLRGTLNAHTHVGDAFLTGRVPNLGLTELVAPPDGYKHRMLAATQPTIVRDAIETAWVEYAQAGTRHMLDFREGGVAGVRLLTQTPRPPELTVTVLGRPAGDGDIVGAADGLGLASPADIGPDDGTTLARLAGKPVAIHVSEGHRDEPTALENLRPDLLVHLCKARSGDLDRLLAHGPAVAVCPTSNARFGLRPPIEALARRGTAWAFGTDNAMFGARSVLGEAELAASWHPTIDDHVWAQALEGFSVETRLGLPTNPRRAALVPITEGRARWERAGAWHPISTNTPPRLNGSGVA